jgi:HAE1 family hydrophobic/amphiphilic exporter-1
MVFTAAVVFGFFSFQRLPVTLMPELTYPSLTVRTEYPGAAPEEVENEISRPIEEALGVLGGLNRLSSVSRAGLSDVTLEFLWGTDMSKAAQEALRNWTLSSFRARPSDPSSSVLIQRSTRSWNSVLPAKARDSKGTRD